METFGVLPIALTYPFIFLYALVTARAHLELVVVRLTPELSAGEKAFADLLEILLAFVAPEREREVDGLVE